MRHVMLFFGVATALAGAACAPGPALPLAIAAARNAADTVRSLLARGVAADSPDERGMTPLMWAARAGATDAMAALLDGGADPNARDAQHRWTPLLHALHRRQAAAVRL